MYHRGMDIHQRMTADYVLDGEGEKVQAFTVNGYWVKVCERGAAAISGVH